MDLELWQGSTATSCVSPHSLAAACAEVLTVVPTGQVTRAGFSELAGSLTARWASLEMPRKTGQQIVEVTKVKKGSFHMTTTTASTNAGLDAYYGEFVSAKEKEVLGVPLRLVSAWSRNDADGVANVFAEEGILILPGDVLKRGRDEIRAFMAAAYAGPFKGTGVTGNPVDVRFAGDDVAVLRTHGGILAAGETEISDELAVRSTWVVVKRDGEWQLASYQNSPRGAGATLRW
jgi:uncharacterized protein (TIGR02246 family)